VIGTRLGSVCASAATRLIEGGTTIDDALKIARLVQASGQVDYINTSIGVATASLFMTRGQHARASR